MVEEQDIPGSEFYSTCRKMDSHMESAMNVVSKLSNLYMTGKNLDKCAKIVHEMEILEGEFHSVYDIAFQSWNLCKQDKLHMTTMSLLNKKNSVKEPGSSRHKEDTSSEQSVIRRNEQRIEAHGGHANVSCIGNDLWMQLKQIQIPTFSGDKRSYRNWKKCFHGVRGYRPGYRRV